MINVFWNKWLIFLVIYCIEHWFNFQIFEKLIEKETTEIFKKIIPIAGDVGEENLGLSAADRQTLIANVNVVIHSAATLDFQENLRPTVNINMLGTRRVTELCKAMKNLKVWFLNRHRILITNDKKIHSENLYIIIKFSQNKMY